MRSTRTLPHALVRAATVFALSAGLAAPALVTAPAAHAAPAPADVTRTTTLDDGRLDVGLPYNTLWAKVSVLASDQPGAPVLATSEELNWHDYDSTTQRPSGWTTRNPVRLPEGTALGDYPVSVDYRLWDGKVQHWNGGSYSHKLRTGVSALSFDRASTDYDHRDVTLSGRATTADPSTGEHTPARAGTKVKVVLSTYGRDWRKVTATTVTGADGAFSLPFTPNAEIRGGTATVVEPAADTVPTDAYPVPAVTVTRTEYRIGTRIDKRRLLLGGTTKVSGRVERLTAEGWRPFAGAPVVSAQRPPDGQHPDSVETIGGAPAAADGSFAYAARPRYAGTEGVYTFLRPSLYLGDSYTPTHDWSQLAVPRPAAFTNVKITLSPYGEVKAVGRLTGSCWDDNRVQLQISFDGRHWQNLKTGTLESGTAGHCPFTVETMGYVSAYYRVYHAESDWLTAAAGRAVHLSRTLTRFSSYSFTPDRPRVNGPLTASGVLQRKVGGVWKPYVGAKVMLVVKPRGENTWYWATKGKTGSGGKYRLGGTAYSDATWAVITEPAGGHFYSETKGKYIDAR
ncbi:hypothetical protein [Streptomyces sp. NPDC050504]|uniref:hypothetical protein n=1 Tax=Streptomyces sp. NPDC050504 TaxID=3365618 RepID=UPI0037AF703D